MLSKPDNGYTNFKLEGTSQYTLDFVDDIPFEWVRQAIHGLETKNPFCVIGETDPGTFICVVGWDCHIIWEKGPDLTEPGGIGHEYIKVNMVEFSKMLYSDIKENVNDWVDFYWGHPENVDERRDELEKLLERLKELIENDKQTFK
ncbi:MULTISPECIES: hypothetical protein [unclassified Butyrivibrio]|uniref:hypothetical protein n=1 Tax=unclassified Butyrivibrio TaxID=2639466 RepID=UPI0003B34030|nr:MULTISPECIES: hypothetical protein [unclassified Butyrivibrio]MDC7294227.1 hypothetical protein [Butyrivibrio sp. DSM 10294]